MQVPTFTCVQPSFPACVPWGCGPVPPFSTVCLPHLDVLACCSQSWPCWAISRAAGRALPLCSAGYSKHNTISLKTWLQWCLGLGPASLVHPLHLPLLWSHLRIWSPQVLLEALAEPGLAPCAIAGDTQTRWPCSGMCQGHTCHLPAGPEHPIFCQTELLVLWAGTE